MHRRYHAELSIEIEDIPDRRLIPTFYPPIDRPKENAPMDAATQFADNQSQQVTIVVKDKASVVDGSTPAVWTSSDPTICDVSPTAPNAPEGNPDPLGRIVWLVARLPGQATVTATCGDATLAVGVGVTTSADASIGVTFEAPVDNPQPPA